MSSACPTWVLNLNCYKSPYLFYEFFYESETQVEAAALWSVGFVTLTFCRYHSKAYNKPSACFCLKLLFHFFKKLDKMSHCALHASSDSLSDIATVSGGGAWLRERWNGWYSYNGGSMKFLLHKMCHTSSWVPLEAFAYLMRSMPDGSFPLKSVIDLTVYRRKLWTRPGLT